LQLKQNVKGEWVRWFAATLAGLVQWLRVGAGWVYGDYCCLLKGYLLNEQVEWSLRNERSEMKKGGLKAVKCFCGTNICRWN